MTIASRSRAALAHLRSISRGVPVPVNADLEGGFATAPEAVGANVAAATATGIAGLSIEDSTGDVSSPLYDFTLSVERIAAARLAIDASGTGVLLTGGFLQAAREIAEKGTFTGLASAVPFGEINGSFGAE